MEDLMVVDVVDQRSRLAKELLEQECETITLKEYLDLSSDRAAKIILSVSSKLQVDDVDNIAQGSKVFYFFLDGKSAEKLRAKGCECVPILRLPLFGQENSYLTAEGSLKYIIDNTDKCLRDMTFGVIGWGKLAKAMAEVLQKFGSKIIVITCSREDKNPTVVGYRHVSWKECDYTQFDCIINTAPSRLFEVNPPVKKGVFVLELASKVYPFDYDEWSKTDVNYLIASSVPSKTCPLSAARLLCDAVLSYSP